MINLIDLHLCKWKFYFGGNTYSEPNTSGDNRGRKIPFTTWLSFKQQMQRIKFHFYILLISRLSFQRYVTYLLENEELTGDFQLIECRLLNILMYMQELTLGFRHLNGIFFTVLSLTEYVYICCKTKGFSISAKLKWAPIPLLPWHLLNFLAFFNICYFIFTVFFMELISPESYSICLSGVTQLTLANLSVDWVIVK